MSLFAVQEDAKIQRERKSIKLPIDIKYEINVFRIDLLIYY